jgi:hypothetical protein
LQRQLSKAEGDALIQRRGAGSRLVGSRVQRQPCHRVFTSRDNNSQLPCATVITGPRPPTTAPKPTATRFAAAPPPPRRRGSPSPSGTGVGRLARRAIPPPTHTYSPRARCTQYLRAVSPGGQALTHSGPSRLPGRRATAPAQAGRAWTRKSRPVGPGCGRPGLFIPRSGAGLGNRDRRASGRRRGLYGLWGCRGGGRGDSGRTALFRPPISPTPRHGRGWV